MSHLPTAATMYRAFERRDPSYEGVFWLGVRTDRHLLPAHLPRAHAQARERRVLRRRRPMRCTRATGRACKCRPLDHGRKPPPLVAKLLVAVEAEPGRRYRDAELAAMGIDPSTARRQFKRYCGMTFQAYHRARRMGLALLDIRKGKTVIDSQLDQGFESGSGFREAFTRLVGAAPSRAQDVGVLHAKWLETPLGAMLALADDRGLHLLDFVDRRGLERALGDAAKAPARAGAARRTPLPRADRARAGASTSPARGTSFETPVALTGSRVPDPRVARAAGRSRPGTTCSYAELAATIGQPQAVRAVGRANGDNRLVDHRALSPRDRRRRRADRLRRRARAQAEAPRSRAHVRPAAVRNAAAVPGAAPPPRSAVGRVVRVHARRGAGAGAGSARLLRG